MIPENVIENVRENTDIADVIGQYVQLKKTGKNLFGLCPFQPENTPSFSVSENKQIFHCFSCGRGGNVFKFIMEYKHVSFPEAVQEVAKMQGIKLPQNYTAKQRVQTNPEISKMMDLYAKATQLYHHVLMNTELGQKALDYLHQRGLSDQTINDYQLGFASNKRLLKPFFEEKKIDYQTMHKSGLFSETHDDQLIDRFANRIMYPIKNEHGKVIAFSGRIIQASKNEPKYLNSPETPIFNKGKTLFNFDIAKQFIRKEHSAILFEGYMDVMSAYQSGVKNGIASMGTSLTEDQIGKIEQHTKQLYVCYDGDKPGQAAINRAVNMLANQSRLKLGVIQMPSGIDPDEYRQKYGEDRFKNYVRAARESTIAFKLRFFKNDYNLNNDEDRIAYINRSLKTIASSPSPVERDLYLQNLSSEFHLKSDDLRAQIKPYLIKHQKHSYHHHINSQISIPQKETTLKQPKLNKIQMAEQMLLNRMLHDHSVWLKVVGIDGFCFADDQYQTIFMFAENYFEHHDQYQVADFVDMFKEPKLQRLVIQIDVLDVSKHISNGEIDDYVNIIMKQAPIENQIKRKQKALKAATKMQDEAKQTQLVVEIIKLQKKRQASKTEATPY
ncbi:DNA primase [Philodulcilactobacillus myokoensis]|nr:DNA primase [Philodulcilactobacillus myokoensis]